MSSMQHYESKVKNTRGEFSSYVQQVLETLSPKQLLLFLLHHAAYGVAMTRPVEKWISDSGKRCIALGYHEVGALLEKHARQEKDHHLMNINDITTLTNTYNENYDNPLILEDLLAIPPTESVLAYQELHEKNIKSDHPYCQVAIEYEIERISVEFGPVLIATCIKSLGSDVIARLEFIPEHIKLDVGHTKLGAMLMEKTLSSIPDSLDPMAHAGSEALNIYQRYLGDCIKTT